jgi:hypothetical protein
MSIGLDYPDYQGYPNWRGPDLTAASSFLLSAATPVSAEGYVTNYASITIYVIPSAPPGADVSVTYYTDSTLTVSVGGFAWVLPENTALHCTIPVLGNYAVFSVTTTDATSTSCIVAAIPQSIYVPNVTYHSDQNYVGAFNSSIPSGTTDTFPLPYVQSGRCSIHFQDLSASGKVSVFLWLANAAGARTTRIYNSNNSAGVIDVSLNVPGVALLLQVDNSDTVAHSVDYFCVVD